MKFSNKLCLKNIILYKISNNRVFIIYTQLYKTILNVLINHIQWRRTDQWREERENSIIIYRYLY